MGLAAGALDAGESCRGGAASSGELEREGEIKMN